MSKFKNRIVFLVNNDYEMPDGYNVIRNSKGLPEHEFFNENLKEIFNPLVKTNIVGVIDSDTKIENPHLEEMVVSLFEFYPEVGFVYTDALIESGGVKFIDYFSGLDLPDESFFLNLAAPVTFDNQPQSKIRVMQQLLAQGKVFVHLPDPLITVFHQ